MQNKHTAFINQIFQQKKFVPPYCPNPKCSCHLYPSTNFYIKFGSTKTNKLPHFNQRYRCKICLRQFSYNYFFLDFRKKIPGLAPEVLYDKVNGMTNLSIARKHKINEQVIRIRLLDMKRQSILWHKRLTQSMLIKEAVAYDGFETFCYSQFDPCYVNTAVGKDSLFTYKINYSPLNRKGRMTNWQKKKNNILLRQFGMYPKNSIRLKTTQIIRFLYEKSYNRSLNLYTDGHKSYLNSLLHDLPALNISHYMTSSKERRDTSNPLFPINHLHLHFRHFTSSNRRETIAFNKNEKGLMCILLLKTMFKNYMSPQILKKCKHNPSRNYNSPAMGIGITDKILNFNDFFKYRITAKQVELDDDEKIFYFDQWNDSRRKILPYNGI